MKTKIIFYLKNGKRKMYLTGTSRRFMPKFSLDNWTSCHLYISYGKAKDVNGKMVTFYNDGIAYNKKDAVQMYRAFLEV